MDIIKTIKESYFIGLIISFMKFAENSYLFDYRRKDEKIGSSKGYKTWMPNSSFYGLLNKLDNLLRRFQKLLYKAVLKSKLLSPLLKERIRKESGSYLVKFLYLLIDNFSSILIIIPALYIVVDLIIRRVGFLASFASIWDELLLIFFVFYYIYRGIKNNGEIGLNFTPMDLPIIIYMILGISHLLLVGPDLRIGIEGFRAVFQHILWYFVASQFIRNMKTSYKILDVFMALGLFLGVHGVYQYIAKVPMPSNWVDISENIQTRAYSIVGSPNILGVLFVLLIPIGISMIFAEKEKKKRIFYIATVLFMMAGLLFTMSRGSWLAFAFAMFIYILALQPKLIVPFIGLLGLFIVFGGSLSDRLLFMISPTYFLRSAAGGRLYRWEIGLDIWKENKLLGLGLGRFGGAVAMNNGLAPFYLDNYYLKTLTEMGLFGIIALGFVILCFLIFSINIIRKQASTEKRVMVIGLFSACIGVLTQNFVENIFEFPAIVVYFWMMVAIINTFKPKTHSQESLKGE